MKRAIELAAQSAAHVMPNPLVGAVIVHDGKIIGEGRHEFYGGPHAEVNAVNSVVDKSLLKESTIYVTLEPCAHFGKTPPCADLLVKHQFKRVVIANPDPFSLVDGKGVEKLKNAGIEVELHVLQAEAREMNKRFLLFHERKRPYVILKWAQTADGFIDRDRESDVPEINWISHPETQVLTHRWRTEEHAILVGWKTVANDNPSLTARAFSGKDPIRIVVDPHLKAPSNATVFKDGNRTLVLNKQKNESNGAVEYIQLIDFDLNSVLLKLYELNILSVIIEGGAHTLQSFIDSNLWDEARVIQSPVKFNCGKLAPSLNRLSEKVVEFGKDRIHIFANYV